VRRKKGELEKKDGNLKAKVNVYTKFETLLTITYS
jgi:hypothetical protein